MLFRYLVLAEASAQKEHKGALGDQHVYVKGLADALAALAEDQTFTKVRG